MIFASEEMRNGYLIHPEHEAVKTMLLGLVEDVIAFDFARTD